MKYLYLFLFMSLTACSDRLVDVAKLEKSLCVESVSDHGIKIVGDIPDASDATVMIDDNGSTYEIPATVRRTKGNRATVAPSSAGQIFPLGAAYKLIIGQSVMDQGVVSSFFNIEVSDKSIQLNKLADGQPNSILKTDASGRPFWAAAVSGVPSGTLVPGDIPDLDATKITTGVFPISMGGTGANTVAGALNNLLPTHSAGKPLVSNGTSVSFSTISSSVISDFSTTFSGLLNNSKATASGVASLDINALIPVEQIPDISSSKVIVEVPVGTNDIVPKSYVDSKFTAKDTYGSTFTGSTITEPTAGASIAVGDGLKPIESRSSIYLLYSNVNGVNSYAFAVQLAGTAASGNSSHLKSSDADYSIKVRKGAVYNCVNKVFGVSTDHSFMAVSEHAFHLKISTDGSSYVYQNVNYQDAAANFVGTGTWTDRIFYNGATQELSLLAGLNSHPSKVSSRLECIVIAP